MSDFKQFGNPIGKGTAYTLELLTPYERKLGVIPAVLNYQYRNKVMGLNEIEFDIPAYFIIDQKDVAHPFYHIVDNGMLIQVHISGQKEPLQYIVDTVNESTDKSTEAQKHIHAFSKEYFLSRKKFLGMELAGRILYYTPDLPERYRVDGDGLPRGVLNDIFEKHGIEVTHIDESLKRKAREISIGSTNIYQFLAHLEETFGCIFKFNGDATKVGIYDSSSFGRDTGITISERNIINTFSEDTRYEDMVTRLYVYGSDEVSIASVNPTGLPYIDDFSYFFKENYLPKYLIDLYNEFAKLPKHNTELNSLVVQRNELLTKRNEAEFYLEVVRDELRQALHWAEALELREKNNTDYVGSDPKYEDSNAWNALKSSAEVKEFINAVKSNTTLTDRSFTSKNITFVSLLELSRSTDEELQKLFKDDLETLQARGGEAGWLAEIDRLKQSYDTINENIKSLQRNNDFNQYMAEHLTAEQFAEGKKALDAVTIEGEYINSDLDSSMLNELLEEGKKELDKMCFPKIQFTVDALDFSQLFDTQDLWNYLLLGDIIYVKTDTGFNYPVHFIGIEHSPDTASLNLQFSSSAALTDSAIFLADLIANATRANGILSMNKDTWNKAATEASAINQQLKEGFDLAQQRLAGASKQVPILDERGFWLYALDSNENPKPEQIRAINNVIALTKDGWETIEVAITPEGINANAIVVGTMSADRIRLGRFESADKTTYWDLETNEIKIGDTFFFSPETGLEIDFQPPAKHKNLISTAEFFTEYSVSMPESARHRFETNATTGELRLIAPREDGTYDFYLAVDSAALTQNFTLLSDNLDMINDIVPKVTVALANSNYDLYSSPVTVTKGKGIYTIIPTISSADLPLSFLQISLTKEDTASETGIVIPPETLALVREWVPDLTWQDTVISGVSSSTVITNERIGMAIENNIENKLAALDITEDGITQRVSSSTKEYFDLNKDQFKGADGNTPYVEDGYWFINGTNTGVKAEGQDGAKGADGAPGKGIKDTRYRYAKTSTPSPEPTESQWSATKPEYAKGDYAWTQVIWEYSDGTSENSAPMMSYIAEDGVGISNTLVAYALSTTNVQPSDSLFSPEVPDSKPGDYVWTRVTLDYTNPDKTDTKFYTVARVGKDGVDAKLISLSASEQVFKNNTLATITVTGLAQNTAITSWTYSSNSGAFTATLPAGVTRSGNTVTIKQSTMTANTLTIKASDGTYSDTVSIAKLADGASGTDGFTVLLTNESQTFPANSSGTVTSYAGGYSDIMAYYGGTPLICTTTTTGLPTVNNTYTVTAITATTGTVTLTPSLVSSNYRITPSALTTDSAIRVLTIVARVNNTNYTFKKTLTYTKSKNGADGSSGKDGVAGKDGVGVKTTTITYGLSTSESTMPTSFTDQVPALQKGHYLWTKTVWSYSDNTTETGYSKTYIPKDGNNGTDGIAGKDGVGIKSTSITYGQSTSGSSYAGITWTSAIPTVTPGNFLWTKTVWTYTDNTSETGYSVGKIGNTGPQGPQGIQGANGKDGIPGVAGKPGIGISKTVIDYAGSTSGTTAPTTGYTTTVPTVAPGNFLWTRTTWTYTDATTETSYSVGLIGKNGNTGADGNPGKDGVGIKKTLIEYAKNTSGTVKPTTGWSTTIPSTVPGDFLWTKTTWTYTDNTNETGYSVGKIGNTGATGPKGADGVAGKDGATPYIGSNGNWWINGIDTGVEADVAPIREEFESYRTQTDKAIKDRVTKTMFNPLTVRVREAEQKLTPTSITQTVENNTTTLATKAEVQTTAESWTAKFSQIGGKNLLYASNVPVSTTSRLITSYDMEEEWQPNTEYTVTIKGSLEGTGTRKWGILGVAISGAHSSGETSFTFVTPSSFSISNLKTLQLYNHPSASAGASTVEWIKLEKGSISTGYDQHPSELYTGITTIDKDGVTVGREGETIETNLGFDGLRIKDGATEIASFTGSGAVINNLEAESISGDVINIMSSSMTFDVGSGTGYYADFSEVLNTIGNRKHLASGVKITINIRSVLNETIRIEGFSGSGAIEVNIYSRVNGYIRTISNSCAIRVYGKNTTHVVSASGYTVISSSDAYVLFDGLNIDSKNALSGKGITSEHGSNVQVLRCDMINCEDALHTSNAGKLQANGTKGNPSRYAALGYGGSIWLSGTIPDGTTSWFVYTFGNVTRTPSSFSPPPTKTVTETRTFNHTDIYTYNVKYGAKSTHYGKAAAQNRWDTSMPQMKGRIVFGSSVYSFISGRNSGTTPTVKIRLRRQNSSHGASASVKPTPDWSGAPSFGGATRGNWTPWVTIPYTLFNSSGYTFSFYNGTTGNSYAIWDRAEIQITRTVTQ